MATLTETVDLLILNLLESEVKDIHFLSILEAVECLTSESSKLLSYNYEKNSTNFYVATTRYQSPSPSSKPQPLYIEGAGAKASLSAVDLGTTQLIALAYTNISEILYIPVLSREPANPGTILEMGDTVVSLRTLHSIILTNSLAKF
ncbi:hypothetical protein EB796_003515 [Bugula neritina]|uniref:Uncharacterized protein n=1 Tax=Bugula neritina TaxID=10212 RepID=A0A7J7KJZ8_BUGNE|nr:hypothetical protein EB796_003515 [Bugula neritina]